MPQTQGPNKRSVFRVFVAGAPIRVRIDDVPYCVMLDASSEGFAFVSRQGLRVGQRVRVHLQVVDRSWRGFAHVRNISRLPGARFRYGCQTAAGQNELRRALRAVALEAQRGQLRRKAARGDQCMI